jgi:hypothetical protein
MLSQTLQLLQETQRNLVAHLENLGREQVRSIVGGDTQTMSTIESDIHTMTEVLRPYVTLFGKNPEEIRVQSSTAPSQEVTEVHTTKRRGRPRGAGRQNSDTFRMPRKPREINMLETTTSKRRGRPKGSKNKPKQDVSPEIVNQIEASGGTAGKDKAAGEKQFHQPLEYKPFLVEALKRAGKPMRFVEIQEAAFAIMQERGEVLPGDSVSASDKSPQPRYKAQTSGLRNKLVGDGTLVRTDDDQYELANSK